MRPVTLDLGGFDDGADLSAMTFRFIVHLGALHGRFGYASWLSGRARDGEGRIWHFEALGDDAADLTCVLCELPFTIACGVCSGTGQQRFWHDAAQAHFNTRCDACDGRGRRTPLSPRDRPEIQSDALRQIYGDAPSWRRAVSS